jgi:hypothetical protein
LWKKTLHPDQFLEMLDQHQLPEPVFAVQRDAYEIVGLDRTNMDDYTIAAEDIVIWTSKLARSRCTFGQMNNM